jgi:hypothetical protein
MVADWQFAIETHKQLSALVQALQDHAPSLSYGDLLAIEAQLEKGLGVVAQELADRRQP